jgi:drug/metabolite transporter (DMT)-like permease
MNYFLLALLSALLFGAATPVSKVLLGSLSFFQLAGLLYLGAALAVAPRAIRRREADRKLDRRNLIRLSGAILFGGILGPVFLLLGLRLSSAVSVSMWLNMEMVATAILGWLIFKDHLGKFGWIGVIGVVAASALLGAGEKSAGLMAGSFVAMACFCWGIDNHLTALIDGMTPAQSTFWKGLVAGIVNLTIGINTEPLTASTSTIAMSLAVGGVSYGLSIVLYITAAQHLGATRSQMAFSSAPFFGAILSAVALGEGFTVVQLSAMAILAVSIAALFRDKHEHEHSHDAMAHEHLHQHDDRHHGHDHDIADAEAAHSHWHEHDQARHSHPHWPDLHHRHRH